MPNQHIRRVSETFRDGVDLNPFDVSSQYVVLAFSSNLSTTVNVAATVTDGHGNAVAAATRFFLKVFATDGARNTAIAWRDNGAGSAVFGNAATTGVACFVTGSSGLASLQLYVANGATNVVRRIEAYAVSETGVGGPVTYTSVTL